jgi:hypothetical protein
MYTCTPTCICIHTRTCQGPGEGTPHLLLAGKFKGKVLRSPLVPELPTSTTSSILAAVVQNSGNSSPRDR